ncbi:hypothetical protein BCR42DRAFT_401522 [Absidia repens]|uniref:Uncharacterized protein n=1 Tax=Absidia repens TaxID=90262 RepID=A0A1X2J2N2_9FUNG|nr:hypothetical protein BCR42DRAFT_401522 [Absidia repens]
MDSVRRQSQHQHQAPLSYHANPYYENDYSHYYGTLSSHDSFDNAYHHHASSSSSYHPSFYPPPPPSHHQYPGTRYVPESFSRRKPLSSKKRPRHYYHETNYKTGFGDKTSIDFSNHNKTSHEQQYQHHDGHLNDHNDSVEDDDDEEEEFMTLLEAEALRNAELNKNVHDSTTTTATTNNTALKEAPHQPADNTTDSVTPIDAELIETSEPQQQDPSTSSATTALPFTKKKHDKAFGVLVSFFRRLAATKHQQRRKKPSVKKTTHQTKGMIQTMWVSTPLGDVMDQQQQQEVIQRLQCQSNTQGLNAIGEGDSGDKPTPHDDATKVASLDHIWVFRCMNTGNEQESVPPSATSSGIWTGFDYENQIRLSQHNDDDNGIELYDTHIRKGLSPVLVIPKRQVCFYAVSNMSDQVSSLQVTCLPNSKNVQFVYRCGPTPSF